MNINGERLWNNLQKLGEIGRDDAGGMHRFSFTDTEKEAKQLVARFMEDAGLEVHEDEMGNLIGRKNGVDPSAKTVLIGSHIDSVPNGGIFDGPAGVLTGVEVLHTMNQNNIETKSPIEVVAFTDEEGARFSSGMLGSLAFTGQLTKSDLLNHRDSEGLTIEDAMKQSGYDPDKIELAKRDPNTIKGYLELHIEQGRVLESRNLPAGIVTGIVGVRWLGIKLRGEAGHAGTTPMNLRKDSLAAAAKIMNYIEELANSYQQAVATVGKMNIEPGGVNIIPGEVEFTVDLRDISQEVINTIEQKIREYTEEICSQREITQEVIIHHDLKPANSSGEIMEAFDQSFRNNEFEPFQMVSGAGHDAMVMEKFTDMGMIFVRSKDGISHNPKEWSDQEDLVVATNILLDTTRNLADQ